MDDHGLLEVIRAAALLLIAMLAIGAVAASDNAQPIVVEAHGSGAWDFNNADVSAEPQAPPPTQAYDLCPYDTPTDKLKVHQA